MVGTIVDPIIIGLLAGFSARALVPGRQHMTIPRTILLGIAGSLIGGSSAILCSPRWRVRHALRLDRL